jgi:ribonucleoside-diphosphate reductase alpha chain
VGVKMTLDGLKKLGLAPEWYTDESLQTVSNGYLGESESPVHMYARLARTAAALLKKPELESEFFDLFWKNWLCPASPVLSNLGTERGLPISCYGNFIPDSIDGIFNSNHEIAMLTKNGGGVGSDWNSIRARGAPIKGNGKSEGVVPWLAVLDRIALSVGQGGVRRAGLQQTLDIEHGDFEEFLNIRRPVGDINRQCLNLHHCINIGDDFMQKVVSGDPEARHKWKELLKTRVETGEPYIMFKDTANKTAPAVFQGKKINNTQLCSEIFLPNDEEHTYVCCLSSLNLVKYDEWSTHVFPSGLTVVELSIYFLDAVVQEFINKADGLAGFEKAVRFSKKCRALGLGVLGWHTLLQKKMLPFDSFESMMLNARIFSQMKSEALKASEKLAKEFEEPEWCKGFGVRNLTQIAVAPTMSNSIISGGHSAGIEPISANCYSMKSAKGTFIRKNKQLVELLESKGLNDVDTWNDIIKNAGSVQHMKQLSQEEKEIFKTAREINQFAIINQAAQRQQFIDQGQSLNLFFTANTSSKYINDVHIHAWQSGLKSLYYLRSETVLKGTKIEYDKGDCVSCQG